MQEKKCKEEENYSDTTINIKLSKQEINENDGCTIIALEKFLDIILMQLKTMT